MSSIIYTPQRYAYARTIYSAQMYTYLYKLPKFLTFFCARMQYNALFEQINQSQSSIPQKMTDFSRKIALFYSIFEPYLASKLSQISSKIGHEKGLLQTPEQPL